MPTVPTYAVRETDVSRTAYVGTVGKNWLRKRNGGQKWVNWIWLVGMNLGFLLFVGVRILFLEIESDIIC